MEKVILGVLMAMAILAAKPVPSKVITATVSDDLNTVGSIVVTLSAPDDSHIFEDEKEILTSIITGNREVLLCLLTMHSLVPNNLEKTYQTGWVCNSWYK